MEEITNQALCPKCGNDTFTIGLVMGSAKASCTECDWHIDPDNMQEACDTPQDHNGNSLIRQ